MTRLPLALALLVGLAAAPAQALEGLQPGMPAPPFSLEALDGRRVALGDLRGHRAALVVFWATWSAKSPELLERVERLHASHGPLGLAVLGVNVESASAHDPAAVRSAVARLGLTFPVLLDRGLTTFAGYGVMAVPTSVLIGADGIVRATLASYPIAEREGFFDLVEATVTGRPAPPRRSSGGPGPGARAVRYFNLGRTAMARGQVDQAAANLGRAIEADPTFVLPRVLLAQVLREQATGVEQVAANGTQLATVRIPPAERERLLQQAEQQATEAIRLDATSASAVTELALVHLVRGDAARARQGLERALVLDPDHALARAQLGALRLEAGETDRGRQDLAEAIALNPLDWRLHITAARAYERQGLQREAADEYRTGVELLWKARRGSREGGGARP